MGQTDRFNRRRLYLLTPITVVLVSLSMYWVHDAVSMGLLRVLSGIAVGIEYTAAGSLLTEFIPQKNRGARLSLLTVLWFVGAAVAYIAGNAVLGTLGGGAAFQQLPLAAMTAASAALTS